MYKSKKVLITGGTGTIGVMLVRRLQDLGADITVVAIDADERARTILGPNVRYRRIDLRDPKACFDVTENQDFVFHLAVVKGNTQVGLTRVASIMVPMIHMNTNMMEAAFKNKVQRYMYVGSICQYPNLPVRKEDDMWTGPCQANDRFAGIVKGMGEAQAEAYMHEFGWDAVRILRLSNVYGPFDDFDPRTAQVIPALIGRMVGGENPVSIAGDGTAVRDFIYSDDVAAAMILALEKAPPCLPINIGCGGKGTSIKEVAETIADLMPVKPKIQWDPSKPTGDKVRILDTTRAKEVLHFTPPRSLRDGIKETIDWYRANMSLAASKTKEAR